MPNESEMFGIVGAEPAH